MAIIISNLSVNCSVRDLYNNLSSEFDDIVEFINALELLFALELISLINEEVQYVNRNKR